MNQQQQEMLNQVATHFDDAEMTLHQFELLITNSDQTVATKQFYLDKIKELNRLIDESQEFLTNLTKNS